LKADANWNYFYDYAGNLIKKTKVGGTETWSCGYDAGNRLVKVEKRTTDGGTLQTEVKYSYDAFGNRLEEDVTSGGTTTVTRFASVDGQVWADLDGSNALKVRYLDGDAVDEIFALEDGNGNLNWYVSDRQGSIQDLIDNAGSAAKRLRYGGFAQNSSWVASYGTPVDDRYQYTGREVDTATGLQFNRAR
jgi:YD repeat-containing protein